MNEATAAGFSAELITIEVGSRGMIDEDEFMAIQAAFDATRADINLLASQLIRTVYSWDHSKSGVHEM